MREKGPQRAGVNGNLQQSSRCHVERMSKENRESGRVQWCVLLPRPQWRECTMRGRHVCAKRWGITQRHGPGRGAGREEAGGDVENPSHSAIESGQRDWQEACCMMHDEQCFLNSDL